MISVVFVPVFMDVCKLMCVINIAHIKYSLQGSGYYTKQPTTH